MADLLRLTCEAVGHKPIDIDPTGGDPWMGGPVAITICDRCERELPHSESAKAFNAEVDRLRAEQKAREDEARSAVPVKRKRWWRR